MSAAPSAPVGTALGGAGNLVGGTVQTAAQAAAPSLSKISNPLDRVEQRVKEQAAGQDPQPPATAAVAAVRALLSAMPPTSSRPRPAPPTPGQGAEHPGRSGPQQVQDYQEAVRAAVASAKKQAEDAAKTAKSVATQGALYASIALILGAIAAFPRRPAQRPEAGLPDHADLRSGKRRSHEEPDPGPRISGESSPPKRGAVFGQDKPATPQGP